MKYDNVIIGGGLSGLTAGISLAKAGRRVCIVSAGQNRLHFFSGSFELLGYTPDGQPVEAPLQGVAALPEHHPYRIIGVDHLSDDMLLAKDILGEAGVNCKGQGEKNHWRVSPTGVLKPAWLTLDEYATCQTPEDLKGKNVHIINVKGFLDFPVELLAEGLRQNGCTVNVSTISIPTLEEARENPTEMRSTNIAKRLEDEESLHAFAEQINRSESKGSKADLVLVPAVLGFHNGKSLQELGTLLNQPVQMVATLPPAVSGVRVSILLRKLFLRYGGTLLTGDTAIGGTVEGGRVTGILTEKLPDERLVADQYILASGSFLSHGLSSDYNHVFEPVLGLDVVASEQRPQWTNEYIFDKQPYMDYGVDVDTEFHVKKDGQVLENMYAVGSVLAHNDSVKLADGTGVSLLTAVHVAELLKN